VAVLVGDGDEEREEQVVVDVQRKKKDILVFIQCSPNPCAGPSKSLLLCGSCF
jgi:hypothetical protein